MGTDISSRLSMPKRSKGIAPILGFLCFVAAVLFAAHVEKFLNSPASGRSESRIITITTGKTFRAVAKQLHDQGLISEPWLFTAWARMKKLTRLVKAGEYELQTSMTPRQILEALLSGSVRLVQITIPEGFNVTDIARRLEESRLVKTGDFLSLVQNAAYISFLGLEGPTLEGYLFPDTYRFHADTSLHGMIEAMVAHWKAVFSPFRARAREVELSAREVMTLASMVEKETALAKEKPLVASVFLNRLRKKMRLECDPTVIYGLKEFDGNLTRKHLQMETPYNTYLHYGLPPGPIANPGLDSIRAVLYPSTSDYLYFVSKNNGSHEFSHTLSAHQIAVRMYQERLKK
jgi:UPF0755 protein